ncbi:hypothetical protein AOG25_10000 [Vibrio alginolyticus]|nr:hypothetical protein AOG25_10000 [Vibrio alginolyticus]
MHKTKLKIACALAILVAVPSTLSVAYSFNTIDSHRAESATSTNEAMFNHDGKHNGSTTNAASGYSWDSSHSAVDCSIKTVTIPGQKKKVQECYEDDADTQGDCSALGSDWVGGRCEYCITKTITTPSTTKKEYSCN